MEINLKNILFPVIWVAKNFVDSWCILFLLDMEQLATDQEGIITWIRMAMTSTGLREGRRFSGFLLPLESNMTVQIDSGMDLQQRFQGEKRFWWLNCREVTVHVLYQENLAMKFYRQGMLNVVSAMSMQVTWNVWPQDGRMRKTSVSWYTYQKQQDEL